VDPSSGSGNFSVTVAGALVLAGIAALLLATALALSGYGRPHGPATPVVSATKAEASMHGAGGALPEAEIEYLLDTTEPTFTPERRSP
jgi:hypothetical protein